jgi:hypothetical protein
MKTSLYREDYYTWNSMHAVTAMAVNDDKKRKQFLDIGYL